jgi:hypothetical protein
VHVTLYKVTAFHSQKEVGKDLFLPVGKKNEKHALISMFGKNGNSKRLYKIYFFARRALISIEKTTKKSIVR